MYAAGGQFSEEEQNRLKKFLAMIEDFESSTGDALVRSRQKVRGLKGFLKKKMLPSCGPIVVDDGVVWQHELRVGGLEIHTEIDLGGRSQVRMQQWISGKTGADSIPVVSLTGFLGLGDTNLDMISVEGGELSAVALSNAARIVVEGAAAAQRDT
jgi:hypothetical protein